MVCVYPHQAVRSCCVQSRAQFFIKACHLKNYSIYSRGDWLFAYFEYDGDDFDADMAKMAADPATQAWWDVVKPLMQPLPDRKEGEFWSDMEEIYHLD